MRERTAPALDLAPHRAAAGVVALPGSKSISNRTLLLAALARRRHARFRGLLDADDVDRMQEALARARHRGRRGTPGTRDFVVHGQGGVIPGQGRALAPRQRRHGVAAAHRRARARRRPLRVSGVARMHERPIGDLVDALRALGADIRYLGNPGFPPLAIGPGRAQRRARPIA